MANKLQITNLSKNYGKFKAVDNCGFNIKENAITAIIGPNGSGKSTILDMISQLVDEDSGKILLDNVDISKFTPEQASNAGISRLFQKSHLFENLTVKDNLILAMDNEDTKLWKNILGMNKFTKHNKITEILEIFEMEQFENKLARELSHGQKRLVEIARAILKPTKLLILDEPTAGIHPKLRKRVSEILRELKKQGVTILLIEHDMNFTFDLADEVIVLDEGKIIAKGTPSEIKVNPKVLDSYLGG